jgi:hypothetical protein
MVDRIQCGMPSCLAKPLIFFLCRNFIEEETYDWEDGLKVREYGERHPAKRLSILRFVDMKLEWRLQWHPGGRKAAHPWLSILRLFEEFDSWCEDENLEKVSAGYFYNVMSSCYKHIHFGNLSDFKECNTCFGCNSELARALQLNEEMLKVEAFALKTSHIEVLRNARMLVYIQSTLAKMFPDLFMIIAGDRGDSHKFWMPACDIRYSFVDISFMRCHFL